MVEVTSGIAAAEPGRSGREVRRTLEADRSTAPQPSRTGRGAAALLAALFRHLLHDMARKAVQRPPPVIATFGLNA